MSDIKVKRNHQLGSEEALRRAQELVGEFASSLNASIDWTGNDARFKGKGFSGSAQVRDDSVAVDVDLGLLLKPLRRTIESKLEKALDERFV